ncbi:MAG: glycerol-3-phosphate 1-O-acyltransferase [Sphingomonadaceae bacterium]|jgi:acyl phosphate:glycerol-3-phosphate acyltransferase|nr:glycerol-3-phosphate 1-O-acyltransferase [Sphingomonadaceae bacterium]NBU79342.1 glycerol-3-phosphate 1-O-acyltransferase [Sphingomonadaceae bacterium]NCA00902.1 glycerol-3-phosphate 1-O-acyltransferase [Sphingomonadaceae bacterium]
MPLWIWPCAALFLGYFLGSIPFGVVLTRAFGAGDIRQIGSGNIGATNVLRTGRKGLAAATLILDALKGVAAVLIVRAMASPSGSALELIAAAGAFFGHLYPVWLKFKGGKGVATLLGLCLILDWRVGLVFALVWLGGMALSRISSVGGMVAALSAPIAAYILGNAYLSILLLVLALAVLWKHQANIRRLLDGTEPRIGQKSA